jgi:hypothetical protein
VGLRGEVPGPLVIISAGRHWRQVLSKHTSRRDEDVITSSTSCRSSCDDEKHNPKKTIPREKPRGSYERVTIELDTDAKSKCPRKDEGGMLSRYRQSNQSLAELTSALWRNWLLFHSEAVAIRILGDDAN